MQKFEIEWSNFPTKKQCSSFDLSAKLIEWDKSFCPWKRFTRVILCRDLLFRLQQKGKKQSVHWETAMLLFNGQRKCNFKHRSDLPWACHWMSNSVIWMSCSSWRRCCTFEVFDIVSWYFKVDFAGGNKWNLPAYPENF